MSIGWNECWMCNIAKNENMRKMTIEFKGKNYCKRHYKMIKEIEKEFKNKSKEEILVSLIKEGERLKLKHNL